MDRVNLFKRCLHILLAVGTSIITYMKGVDEGAVIEQ